MIKDIKKLESSPVKKEVEKRLGDFRLLGMKSNDEWFSELCFCLLTANSKAATALAIQEELGSKGFLSFPKNKIIAVIKKNKHRFHNNKAEFIVGARKYEKIKNIIKIGEDPRAWLVKNVKGLGWKEASHFLRNVGYTKYAILDRHIINLMVENGLLDEKPKSLNKNKYLDIEEKFKMIAKKTKMNCAELDLYMWYIKTGKVLK